MIDKVTKKSNDKSTARKQAFAARKGGHDTGLDLRANALLDDYLRGVSDFQIVAGYLAIRTEIDPLPVMTALFAAGKTVCVPVIRGAGQPLDFSRWTPDTTLVPGPFGAMVPAADDFVDPDVLITPLVAFDATGFRLGYGGGFYDRTFAGLRALKNIHAVGFAYGAQQLAHIPTEPTDQRLDALVTESEVLVF